MRRFRCGADATPTLKVIPILDCVTYDLTGEQIVELRQKRRQGVLIKTLMRDYELSKASVYRYLDESPAESLEPTKPQ